MAKTKVLFLCTGNSARSQMAEAFLRRYGGDRFDAYSAGLEPGSDIHPLTRRVMREVGFDLEGQYAKSVMTYMGKVNFGFLITVCAKAEKNCPSTFPGVAQRLHWDLGDPATFVGPEPEALAKFREVRDEIDARVRQWVAAQGVPGPEAARVA